MRILLSIVFQSVLKKEFIPFLPQQFVVGHCFSNETLLGNDVFGIGRLNKGNQHLFIKMLYTISKGIHATDHKNVVFIFFSYKYILYMYSHLF